MQRHFITFAAVLMCFSIALSIAPGCAADKGWVGLDGLTDLIQLQELNDGVQCLGASSYDRDGGNDDFGNFLYTSGSEYVMLDVKGPGCIYRFWCTGMDQLTQFRFYFDGEPTPRKTITAAYLFNGTFDPFLTPLVGNDTKSSGGWYDYLPMPFREGCKITSSTGGFYYNINYHKYADADGVTTWTGTEDSSEAVATWSSCGTDPKDDYSPTTYQNTISIAGRTKATILDHTGTGMVTRLELNIPQIIPGDALSDLLLQMVYIRMTWDDSPYPQVWAPLGLFFGCHIGEYDVRSVPVGMDDSGGNYYCFFPMSFASRAKIEIVNTHPTALSSVTYRVDVASVPEVAQKLADGEIGYFYARHYKRFSLRFGKDYVLLDTAGKGKVVGFTVNMRGNTTRHYLEGDERFHVDDCASPSIYGTGTEDYFNGGWYFNHGTFNCPVHGNPAHEVSSELDYTACYRFHQSDYIPYQKNARFGLEHGVVNDRGSDYHSVAFYYQRKDAGIDLTDMLDVGDWQDESKHNYVVSGLTSSPMYYKYYEGDNDDVQVLDHGKIFTGYSQFTVKIDPANHGVRLMRRMDYSYPNTWGDVYVDGAYVGPWYQAGSNTSKSWRETSFDIPGSFTAGKDSITVKIINRSGFFNEFFYWVYSFVDTPNLKFYLADFDECYDTSAGNYQGIYRDTDADIEYAYEGGFCIGSVAAGEWLKFNNIQVPAGMYDIKLRYYNGQSDTKLAHLEIDSVNVTGTISLPNTGSEDYDTVTLGPYWIDGGSHEFKLVSESSGQKYHYFELVKVLDIDPPQDFTPVANPPSWTSGPIEIQFSTVDEPGGWGMDHYEARIDSGAYQVVTSPWVINPGDVSTGPHTVWIKAVDKAGNYREKSVDIYYALQAGTVLDLKAEADGVWAMLSGKVVTAVYGDCFYVEEPDRLSGIKVFSNDVVVEGDAPSLVGRLATVSGERVLDCR